MRDLSDEEMELLEGYLLSDMYKGDPASSLLEGIDGTASIYVEEECILSGIEPAMYLFDLMGAECVPETGVNPGVSWDPTDPVLTITGPIQGILKVERTVLNILSRMTGIATLARGASDIAERGSPGTRVAGTRKTTPGFTPFEKRALMDGGALPHRMSLSSLAMLKDNHLIALGGDVKTLIEAIRTLKERYGPYMPIEVEVESMGMGVAALEAGADIIMLDNMTPEQCGESAAKIRSRSDELKRRVTLEASGGIGMDDIPEYAPHVDVISMGSLTQGSSPIGFRLDIG